MSRDIKFRIWDNEFKKMDYPVSYVLSNNWFGVTSSFYLDDNETYDYPIDNKDYELMQFIGLTDKYGKEIYEGDILQCTTGIAYVVWEDAAFALKSPGSEAVDWEHSSYYEKCEIIGNIHDNPELIKP